MKSPVQDLFISSLLYRPLSQTVGKLMYVEDADCRSVKQRS